MLSRTSFLLRTCHCLSKPPVYTKTQFHKHIAFITSAKCKNMSTITDDMLNEPGRNLNYFQLLEKKKDAKTVLIDVREHSEINETGKLPGSIHIPLIDLEKVLRDSTAEEFYNIYKVPKPNTDAQIFSIPVGELSHALSQMTPDEFKNKYSAIQPSKDLNVIFSCKAGGRSRKAMAQAYGLGYKDAAHYKGGWLDWEENSKKHQN